MEHKRLLSGGVLALCAVFAALALFAAPVLGGKGGFSVRSFSPQGETDFKVYPNSEGAYKEKKDE